MKRLQQLTRKTVARSIPCLLLIGLWIGASGFSCGGEETVPGAASGHCPSGVYLGNVEGLQATAKVQIETLPSYTLVGGEVTSATAHYLFKVELVGARGWGEMINTRQNERFRVQLDVTADGFVLTANPFGGAVSYTFQCRS